MRDDLALPGQERDMTRPLRFARGLGVAHVGHRHREAEHQDECGYDDEAATHPEEAREQAHDRGRDQHLQDPGTVADERRPELQQRTLR